MPSSPLPESPGKRPPPRRTLYVEDEVWERIQDVGWNSRPRRSASDLVREMVDRELPRLEDELRNGSRRP
jgi:hypothetical protein